MKLLRTGLILEYDNIPPMNINYDLFRTHFELSNFNVLHECMYLRNYVDILVRLETESDLSHAAIEQPGSYAKVYLVGPTFSVVFWSIFLRYEAMCGTSFLVSRIPGADINACLFKTAFNSGFGDRNAAIFLDKSGRVLPLIPSIFTSFPSRSTRHKQSKENV